MYDSEIQQLYFKTIGPFYNQYSKLNNSLGLFNVLTPCSAVKVFVRFSKIVNSSYNHCFQKMKNSYFSF